jgi:beta-lactamase class D
MTTLNRMAFMLIALAGLHSVYCQQAIEKDFSGIFNEYGVNGCFVLFDETGNTIIRYQPDLCDSGYIPASTFKIPHALIALEEGVIKDTSQIIEWDGHQWPVVSWNKDQTLRTSMKYSCVWVYSGFTSSIGASTYHQYVEAFNYGNKDITGQPARFWLAGLLRISANQQVEFLRKLYHYELPVSERSIDIVKDIIVLEKTDTWKLSGKTGGGLLDDNTYIMWLVGYLEREGRVYFYAMNFTSDDFNKTSKARFEITKRILTELKLME